jgi:hypothetical protein
VGKNRRQWSRVLPDSSAIFAHASDLHLSAWAKSPFK